MISFQVVDANYFIILYKQFPYDVLYIQSFRVTMYENR
ncbi:hypothetical protein B4113_1639 [Geobacillus sp. B4113_201601]|nr:hypothetical protein B4113_1639 [Geobacillus sp. B4113_201601]